jgi:hypothetical protein
VPQRHAFPAPRTLNIGKQTIIGRHILEKTVHTVSWFWMLAAFEGEERWRKAQLKMNMDAKKTRPPSAIDSSVNSFEAIVYGFDQMSARRSGLQKRAAVVTDEGEGDKNSNKKSTSVCPRRRLLHTLPMTSPASRSAFLPEP